MISKSKKNAYMLPKIGANIFNVVNSGKEIFFKARNVKKGKGANNNDLNKGIK